MACLYLNCLVDFSIHTCPYMFGRLVGSWGDGLKTTLPTMRKFILNKDDRKISNQYQSLNQQGENKILNTA